MKINLEFIKPSPNPIRKTWDEASMMDLMWSLMEEGQVEPVGLSQTAENDYTIVWGHRRVHAARKANWKEIEAVIVPTDEVDNLIQAGIENLSKEEMSVDDKAEWAFRLTELGLSHSEIGRRSGVPSQTIDKWIIYKREKEQGLPTWRKQYSQDEGLAKIVNVARVFGNDIKSKKAVLGKVFGENISNIQAQELAEAYRDAPTPEVKAAVIDVPVERKDTKADILRRATHRVEVETGQKIQDELDNHWNEIKTKQTMENWNDAVKDFLDSMKNLSVLADQGTNLVRFGKYSPEAARFTIRKIEKLIDALKNYKETLETVK